jgi:carotenoid cleavage dioxygenase-like enzyme
MNDVDVGQKWDVTYVSLSKSKNDLATGVGRYSKDKFVSRYLEEGQYLGEPLFVQNPEKEKDKGWVIAVNHDGNNKRSIPIILTIKSSFEYLR